MFSSTVPLKIIPPKDWFIELGTTLDSTNPVVLPTFVCIFDMTP